LSILVKKVKVGIIGGTGYTGAELLRLLLVHPHVDVMVISSRAESGVAVADTFINLRGYTDLVFSKPTAEVFSECDVVFCAAPNGIAMTYARAFQQQGIKLIDLAADFRLKQVDVWEQWYGMRHACPELLADAVYGLPELNRAAVKDAPIVANPGCYPTATTLGLMPLLKAGVVRADSLIADVKSGVTGAGRAASVSNLYSEVSDSFKAYGVAGHRHSPEILANLANLTASDVGLTFVPHLTPMLRGIHATLYADLLQPDVTLEELQGLYDVAYTDEPFVDVMPSGSYPDTRSVKSSNMCRIAVHRAAGSGKVVVLSVIDNLTKGAAGQAVQNMNIMYSLPELTGLKSPAILP
jgi:N-acetyl-gamma-glutamyl-phosphate reductase